MDILRLFSLRLAFICCNIHTTTGPELVRPNIVWLTPYVESLPVLLVPDQVGDAEGGSQLQLHIRMPLTKRQDESEMERQTQ